MLSHEELCLRAALFRSIRSFFEEHHFLEVDTPIRQPVVLPERHILPVTSEDYYLQTSPELYMKKLLAQGCNRIFQICRCFRKEERGRRHLEEFTMLEWYRRDADYTVLMEDCEKLLCYVASDLADAKCISVEKCQYLLQSPWQKKSVKEAFITWSPVSLKTALARDIFDEIVVEHIEPRLALKKPAFLFDYPVEMASLAKIKKGEQEVAERVELYLQGVELANGFSELTDAVEQRARFTEEICAIATATRKDVVMPEGFLEALEKIDKAAGIALGIDRLFMFLLGKDHIGDAVTFAPDDA